MRYEKGHKASTRLKIVQTAATEFRRRGLDGIGVADLMARAGLTHGGFYSHFKSKEELVQAALDEAFATSRMRRMADDGASLEQIVRWYLRPEHRDNPQLGCAAACLVAEIGRQSGATRRHFTESIKKLVALIQSKLPRGAREPHRTATAIFSTMLGALQIARTVNDTELSDLTLQTGIETALHLADL